MFQCYITSPALRHCGGCGLVLTVICFKLVWTGEGEWRGLCPLSHSYLPPAPDTVLWLYVSDRL